MSVLLTRKAVLRGAIESVYDTPAALGANDGILVSKPMFSIKPNVLERDYTRNDLSPMAHIIGRKLASMEFETELRGNGRSNTGLLADLPIIGRLLRACGYKATASTIPSALGPFVVGDDLASVVWAADAGNFAKGSFVLATSYNFSNAETVTIGTHVYTFKTALTPAADEVLIGASGAASLQNLTDAINGTGTPGTQYGTGTAVNADGTASYDGISTITFTDGTVGTAGNSVATTTTAAHAAWGGATLSGGSAAATNTDVIAYYVKVTTGGASGAAQVTVTSDTQGEGSGPSTVTSGTPLTLGTKGLKLTPTWTGNLVLNTQWVVWLRPSGTSLDPISDNFESITLELHKDGVMHVMPGSFGTFEITAAAGNYAHIKWTFTGTYHAPTDDPNPAPNFETTLPHQVELARLHMKTFQPVVEKFTFNQRNDIQIRPDVSSSDGYIGTRIVSRKPEGGIDPEADLVANNDFWGDLASANRMQFQMRVGVDPGNTVWVMAPCVQYTGMTYTDRNGILAYDAGLRFARVNGNDEISFFFC